MEKIRCHRRASYISPPRQASNSAGFDVQRTWGMTEPSGAIVTGVGIGWSCCVGCIGACCICCIVGACCIAIGTCCIGWLGYICGIICCVHGGWNAWLSAGIMGTNGGCCWAAGIAGCIVAKGGTWPWSPGCISRPSEAQGKSVSMYNSCPRVHTALSAPAQTCDAPTRAQCSRLGVAANGLRQCISLAFNL